MKTKSLFLITNTLLYFFAGISAFFFIMVIFTDAINDFRMFFNYLPLYITLILPIYALIAVNRIAKVDSDNLKLRKIKIHALILSVISVVALGYGLINTFVSFGGNFLAGGPSKYFPLSFLILNLLFVLIGVYILFVFRNEKCVAETKVKSGVLKVMADVLKHLFLLFALYFLGTFAFSFYSFDLSLNHIWGTLPLYLLFVIPSLIIITNEIIKACATFEKQKSARFILGLCGLGLTLVLGVWMFIYMNAYPNFVVEAMTASFAVDFAISANLGPVLSFVISLIPAIYLIVGYLIPNYIPIYKKRQNKG
ncbi:MAG: hypothetical protein WCX85_03700 [Bacilli bacterium]|jgi:hypothetical protein